MNNQEKNRATLRRAIDALPEKKAPQESWNTISYRLSEEQQFAQLSVVARQMPMLSAPDGVWATIEEELTRPAAPPTLSLRPRQWLGWAAAIALALAAAWYAWPTQPAATVTVSVASQEADPTLLTTDWDADEAAFAQVSALYRKHQQVFSSPTGRDWLAELQELNDARSELKAAIQTYGRDAVLLNQLADIERERSAILKKMAQHI